MSEATLKKKTRVQYNNMSVGSKNGGFSINGTRRSQGYVGQTMLGRHFPSTPMRGNVARGNGGCCGTYRKGTIIQSGVCFPSNPINGSTANNDPRVVKSSVLSNDGMIRTQYRWIWRPQPYTSVKVDSNKIQGTQNQYIENKASKTINNLAKCNNIDYKCSGTYNKPIGNTSLSGCSNLSIFQKPRPFGTVINISRCWKNITKSNVQLNPVNQSDFIKALSGSMSQNNTKQYSSIRHSNLPGPAASY